MPEAHQDEDLVPLLTDHTAVLCHALDRGDVTSAATALATIRQAADQALAHLDPDETVSPAITHHNGRYIAPALESSQET